LGARELAKKIVDRVIRAIIHGVLLYFLVYRIPLILLSSLEEGIAGEMAFGGPDPRTMITYMAIIVIFYAVAIQLTRDTVLEHVFSVGKDLTLIFFFIYSMGGGVMEIDIPGITGFPLPLKLTVDLGFLLTMIICVELLGVGRSIMRAIYSLSEEAEEAT